MKSQLCLILGCLALAAAAPAESTDAAAEVTAAPTESAALVETIGSTGDAMPESANLEETTVKEEKSAEMNAEETTPAPEKSSEMSEKASEKMQEPPTESKDKDKPEESAEKPSN